MVVFNAGMGVQDYSNPVLSNDGIEMTFQVNHLSHFLIFKHIRSLLEKTTTQFSTPVTIVHVSSAAHYSGNGDNTGIYTSLEEINTNSIGYNAYGQSKLANVLFSNKIAKIYLNKGISIYSNSCHPGLVATNIFKGIFNAIDQTVEPFSSLFLFLMLKLQDGLMWTSEKGALTQVIKSN